MQRFFSSILTAAEYIVRNLKPNGVKKIIFVAGKFGPAVIVTLIPFFMEPFRNFPLELVLSGGLKLQSN